MASPREAFPFLRLTSVCAAALALFAAADPARAQILSSKRGFADTGANYNNLKATGAGWYYTWGTGAANPGFYQNASTAATLFRDNGCQELGGTLTNNIPYPNPLAGQPGQPATVTVAVPVNAANPAVNSGTTLSQCRFQFSNSAAM